MTFEADRTAIQTATDAALTNAQAYLNQLVALVGNNLGTVPFSVDAVLGTISYFPEVPDSPQAVQFSTDMPSPPDLVALDIPAAPDAPTGASTLLVPAPPELPQFSFSSFTPIELPVDDLLAPTAVFEFAEAAYDSTLLDPLKAKLLYDLQNGGYGIDTADEVALFNRARDREVEAMLSRIEDAGRGMAARGFPLPPGELSIHVDRAYQDMQNKVSSASRDITLERSKLFVENRQFTIREVKEVETVLLGFHNSVQERALNTAKFTAEFAITIYNALLAKFKLRFEFAKASSDVQYQQIQADAARAQALLEQYRGQIAAFDVGLRAVIQPFQLQVDTYRAQIAGYEATIRGKVDPARLQTELYRARLDGTRVVGELQVAAAETQFKAYQAVVGFITEQERLAVETAKVKLAAAIEALRFKIEAVKFGSANYFAQLTALENSANSLSVQTGTY